MQQAIELYRKKITAATSSLQKNIPIESEDLYKAHTAALTEAVTLLSERGIGDMKTVVEPLVNKMKENIVSFNKESKAIDSGISNYRIV